MKTQQIIMSNVTSFWYVSKFQPLWQRLKETKILDLYFLILNSSVLCSCSVPKQNKLSPFKNPGSVMGLLQRTVISIFVFFSCFLARENSIILGKSPRNFEPTQMWQPWMTRFTNLLWTAVYVLWGTSNKQTIILSFENLYFCRMLAAGFCSIAFAQNRPRSNRFRIWTDRFLFKLAVDQNNHGTNKWWLENKT